MFEAGKDVNALVILLHGIVIPVVMLDCGMLIPLVMFDWVIVNALFFPVTLEAGIVMPVVMFC